METWATFSIIDHRKPLYRQALALFDRIVVPIPPKPIGNQTREELDQLSAEVDALYAAKAAVAYPWDSAEFEQWRIPYMAEALSANMNRDPYLDTRLMLAEQFKNPGEHLGSRLQLEEQIDFQDVEAIPVHGSPESFAELCRTLGGAEQALMFEVMQKLPIPDEDTPLENLIRLRQSPAFRTALDDLLEWKRKEAPAIVLVEEKGRKRALEAAMRDFDRLTKAYAEAMESEGYKKAGSVGSIFFALFTGEPLGAIKETLVSFRELREPCWKKLSEMKCAPGAVVYHFQEAIH
jgi:hypothetical protein